MLRCQNQGVRLALLGFLVLGINAVGVQGRPLEAGDRLEVACEEEPTLNGMTVLSASGQARVGILGSVALGGLTLEESEARLGRLLRERRPEARGLVRLVLVSGADAFVRYAGAVEVSGKTLASDELRLSGIVLLAQPTLAADLGRVRITGSDGKARWVAYAESSEQPDLHNPRLTRGDRIFFELATGTDDVVVLGGVARPQNVPSREAKSVADAIRACGGTLIHANPQDISVWRGGVVVERLNLARAGAVPLQAGDTLRIGLIDDRRFVTVLGAVRKPGRIPYFEGMGYRDVLSEAGGAMGEAALEDAVVKTGTGVRKAGARELASGSFRISPGDLVEIPSAPPGSTRSLASRLGLALSRMGR